MYFRETHEDTRETNQWLEFIFFIYLLLLGPGWLWEPRVVQWYFTLCLVGFTLLTVNLNIPNIATDFFGGTGVCPAHAVVTSEACKNARSEAQLWISISQGINSFLGLAMGPSLGAISDVYGRRFFVLTAYGLFLASTWLVVGLAYGYVDFWIYIVFNTCTGLAPVLPALLSVVADESAPERRAANFGILLSCFELPLLLIPVLASKLSVDMNMLVAGCVGSVAFMSLVAYGESLPTERRSAALSSSNRIWAPHKALAILNSAPMFRRLSLVILSNALVLAGLQACFLLYVESAYGITAAEAITYLSLLAVGGLLSQLILLPFLTRYFRLNHIMVGALLCQFLENVVFVIVSKPLLVTGCRVSPKGWA